MALAQYAATGCMNCTFYATADEQMKAVMALAMTVEPVFVAKTANHGAGRAMGRKAAARTLDQATVDRSFEERDILTNCRLYPIDEAPAAYLVIFGMPIKLETAVQAAIVARGKK